MVCAVLLAAGWAPAAPASSLAEIYRLAVKHDAEFAAAQAAYRAGQEAWPQARAAILPTVSAFANYTETEREVEATPFSGAPSPSSTGAPTPPFTDEFGAETYGVELRQPLFDWGIPATLRQGHDRVDLAVLEFAAAREALLARVMTAYLAFLRSQASLELTLAERRAIAADLARTKGRYEVGAISITALREAQAALDLAESRIISARAALDQARESLRLITTVWFEDLPGLEGGVEPVPPDIEIEAWVARSLRYNPDYLAALQEADIAEDEIEVERSDYIPEVDLVLAYQDIDQTEFVFGSASNDSSIGLEATWTLFAGGRNSSEVREARALYERAQALVESTRRTVVAGVRNSYRDILTSIRRLDALEQAIASAEIALASVRAEFELGARTKADVLDARRDLFSARIEHVQSAYDYLTAALVLKLNAGTLSSEDLLRLDASLAAPGDVPAAVDLPVTGPPPENPE